MEIKLDQIVKFFGSIKALDNASIYIRSGEIVGLLGENGAGKTTLMNILYGLYRPDKGVIFVNGVKRHYMDPLYSMKIGIYFIQQFPRLIDSMTGAENLRLLLRGDKRNIPDLVKEYSVKYNLYVDFNKRVAEMTILERQKLYTLMSVILGARVLLLDEPNMLLTTDKSFREFLRRYAREGNSILISSHKISAVIDLVDRIYVMRKGRVVADIRENIRERYDEILKLMFEYGVGRDKEYLETIHSEYTTSGPRENIFEKRILELKDLVIREDIKKINISVNNGEIVSIISIAGKGDKELFDVLVGFKRSIRGKILYKSIDISSEPPYRRVAHGIFFVPDNKLDLISPRYKIREIMGLWGIRNSEISKCLSETSVMYRSPEANVSEFSGGNISRMILAIVACNKPNLVIAHNIFSGLDLLGYEIATRLIKRLRMQGVSFLLILNDYEEALRISDRIYVLNERGAIEINLNEAYKDPSVIWREMVS
ncbi:MAG: ATP-binding cassette domain-containing protein [Sulfolobales archaeon]